MYRSQQRRIGVVIGTRPEALKLAPVVQALRRHPERFETCVVSTGQHRQMLDQMLSRFGIVPDTDLDLMKPNQSLAGITTGVLEAISRWLATAAPELLVVQGDTTTAFAASLAAFYARTPVAHVEAGLRSYDLANPFPEEANRRLTTVLADLHFAPTPLARRRLVAEGVPRARIAVTGNTIVDSLLALPDAPAPVTVPEVEGRLLVVTSHRRESWGRDLEQVCLALRDLVARFPDLSVVYPVHLNPNVRETVMRCLGGVDRVHLVPPMDYVDFVALMRRADVILTDSGGVQEEAPSLGKPLLVLRTVTERPEAFRAGLARLIGTDRDAIVAAVSRLLTDPDAYRAMTAGVNPYGDGRASERIVEAITRWFAGRRLLLRRRQEFRPPLLVTR